MNNSSSTRNSSKETDKTFQEPSPENPDTVFIQGSASVEDSVSSKHKSTKLLLSAKCSYMDSFNFANDVTRRSEGTPTNPEKRKIDFNEFVRTHDLHTDIVTRLVKEDLDDIELLKEFDRSDICSLELTTEHEASLVKALEILGSGHANQANEVAAWAAQNDIDLETVKKLRLSGFYKLDELKKITQDEIKALQISKGRSMRLSKAIKKLNDTEFCRYLKERKIKEETLLKLIQNDFDSVNTFMLMKKEQVESLNVLESQQLLLLKIIQDLNEEEKETTAISYDKAYEQFLKEISLEEATIDTLKNYGLDSPEALTDLYKELDKVTLSQDQRRILLDAIEQLKKIEEDPDMENEITKSTKRKDSYSATMSSKYPAYDDGTKRDNKGRRLYEAVGRFWNSTLGIGKTAFANVASYMRKAKTEPHQIITENGMRIVKLPVKQVYANTDAKIRKCTIGKSSIKKQEKTIMVVGVTGAGKSKLIDGMCNYIFDTKWEQHNRIKLIDVQKDELKNTKEGETMSQTEWITIYTINTGDSNRMPYTLNLIDTPGFGDTRGMIRDQELVEQIRSLFKNEAQHGIDTIDAVCFVAKNPDARLTPTQSYIFNSIMSIFGKDIKGNILVMITFADGAESPVLKAINKANLPYRQAFLFNNSALFANNGISLVPKANSDSLKSDFTQISKSHEIKPNPTASSDTSVDELNNTSTFGKMFWDMGIKSFENFFDFLGLLSQKSLILTNEVLEQRRDLKGILAGLEEKITIGLSTMDQLKQEEKLFKENKNRINDNKNFTYTLDKHYSVKIDCKPGEHVTHCMECHETCHNNCLIGDDLNKGKCRAIDKATGKCRSCKGKCHWRKHKNVGYYPQHKTEKIQQTFENKKKEYEKATGIAAQKKDIIKRIQVQYEECENEVSDYVKRCRDILQLLRKIALKPDPLTEVDYIEELVMVEKDERKEEWQQRIEQLNKLKTEAERLQKVDQNKIDLKSFRRK